ncbi:hypothetical protein PHJA_001038300 [Phtheirospermum japonicum]|uniref:Late embryogenesis abundant protein LEA-2 subgroup domain-containing protein n=1 Tax=Phtheirospermum japonicum TaxID=374723 RepID=A0A830BQ41_9LAMI|nr:hypothetical protein PHJA_001038300 [Phtheirospermum japonicum]
MEEENQTHHHNPLQTPPITEKLKTDELESATYYPPPPDHQKRTSKCLVYALLAAVLHSTAFLIFGLVVLRVRTPTLRLSTAAVHGLRYGPPSLNMTIVAGIRLRNTNFGRFVFGDANAVFLLGNDTFGTGVIHGGGVGSREGREMNLSVRVNYNMNISGDSNNMIGLRSFAKLRGEVRVLKMMNRRRSALMNCTLGLNFTSHQIQGLLCQ